MKNPYQINSNDITPEMVNDLLEGKVVENVQSQISNLDTNSPQGRARKQELLRREKAKKLAARDAAKGQRQGYKVDAQGRPLKGQTGKIDTSYTPTPEEEREAQNSSQKHEGDLVELKLRTTKKKFVGQNLGKKSQKPPTSGELPVGKEAEGVRNLSKRNKKVGKHGDMANLVAAHENKEYNTFKEYLNETGEKRSN